MSTVKIVRTQHGETTHAEVLERYLPDFEKDGWKAVSEKDDLAAREKESKEQAAKDADAERERLVNEALAAQDKEDENKRALARIEAGIREKEENDAIELQNELRLAGEKAKKGHEHKIVLMEDKDEIKAYIKDNFDKNLDTKGSVDSVKDKALAIVNES